MSKSKSNVSKNARTNRGATFKVFYLHNEKKTEVVPIMFYGVFLGLGNYMALQDKSSKQVLLDKNNSPIAWSSADLLRESV